MHLYAGIVSRGIAFVIDAIISFLLCTIGFELTRAVLAALRATFGAEDRAGTIAYLVALPVVFAVYCVVFWTLVGRTPGKMLVGLRVVTADGRPPNLTRSVIRALSYWISAILLIGFAWIAIDQRHQGFHDKLARTFVLYDGATLDNGQLDERVTGGPARPSEADESQVLTL